MFGNFGSKQITSNASRMQEGNLMLKISTMKGQDYCTDGIKDNGSSKNYIQHPLLWFLDRKL